jgi:hypothetical protein
MRSLLAYLIFLIALVTGCAAPARTFRFASDVTPTERAEFRDAVDFVNKQVLPDERMYEAADDEYSDELWAVQFTNAIWHEERGYVDGVTCRERAVQSITCPIGPYMIRIRRGMPSTRTIVVSEHETLHAIGLDHLKDNSDPLSIMRPFTRDDSHWTVDDTAECQRVGACASVMGHPALPSDHALIR